MGDNGRGRCTVSLRGTSMTAAIVARVGVPTSRRSRSPARAVPGQSDATRGSGLRPRDLIPLARRGPPAGRRPTAQTTTSSILLSTSPSCTSATTSSSCSSATSSSCSSTTSSSTPLAPAGAATSCSGDGDVLPTVKVGWPAARAAGRGCAAGVLDLYYYLIPGGVAALAAARLAPPASGLAAALGKGCVGSSSKDCDTAPLLQGLARLRARCPRHTAGVRSRPSSSSYTYHSTRRRCVPCSAALAPDWAPPMVVSSDPA